MWLMEIFMSLKSKISHYIGSHRFLSRKLRSFQPDISCLAITHKFDLYLDPKDLYGPSYYVMYDKGAAFYHYEESLKAEILQHLPTAGVFFDVGANIGLISLFVSKFHPDAKVYSFEPGSIVGRCLKETIVKNKFKNLTLIQKGVSDHTGSAEFFLDPKSTGGSSLIKVHAGSKNQYVEKIELVSLDDFTQEAGVIPNVIKIDIEGAEEFALKGARQLISKHSPHLIIEVDHKNFLSNSEFWLETLKNYQVRAIGETEFSEISSLTEKIRLDFKKGILNRDYSFKPIV